MTEDLKQHVTKEPVKCVFTLERKARAIRDTGGLLLTITLPARFSGQDERYEQDLKQAEAHQQLCFEAFTVFSETGMTPREMMERIKAMENPYSGSYENPNK